ncbi:MAG: ABC1 kinase family protein, partial [Christensenellales bacterium]
LERFHALNQDVVFVTSPILYRAYTTTNVLVMERIDGMGIDEHDKLVEAGYDLAEIGAKLADNYVRQIMEDGFFHADPHPGNIRIRDGKIVWLDMGMMGSLNEKERKLIGNAIVGVARGDIALVRDAVLGLGEFHGTADKKQLYRDIEAMLDKYGSADLGTMDLAEVFEDMTSVMKTNGIAMPSSLTMLARGLATIEGVVADLSPELNIMNVITARIGDQMFDNVDWRALLTQDARAIYESSRKSLEIPALLADILRTGLKGEANLGVEHHAGEDVRKLVIAMVRKLCLMLLSLGLLIFGGAAAGNGPQVFDLSIYSSGCFVLALCAAGFALWNKKK